MSMTYIGGGANAVRISSPATHNLQAWGSTVPMVIATVASIGAGVANTTNQGYTTSAYPYLYLYDVVASVATSGTGGVHSLDIFTAISGGSSYLATPLVIPNSVAAITSFSGRFQTNTVIKTANDPYLAPTQFRTSGVYSFGAIFSLRAVTPATTGALTDVRVRVIGFCSDTPFDGS